MKSLKVLIPHLDTILNKFYDEVLTHKQLTQLFQNNQQIKDLVIKQKQNFVDSLNEGAEKLYQRYHWLGKLHYDLMIPSTDFLKSTDIWRQSFIYYAINDLKDLELILKIEEYFAISDNAMAKGYLDKQIDADEHDLNVLINEYKAIGSNSVTHTLDNLNWLKSFLQAIREVDISLSPELDINKCKSHHFQLDEYHGNEVLFSRDHLDEMHTRLHNDANSLFYFIETRNYPEVLAIYSSLLSVYKISLITMSNLTLQREKVHAQNELAQAKKEIDMLRGILPICTYCSKIQTNDGDWSDMQNYIQAHSEAEFQNEICPSCKSLLKSQ